MTQRLLLGGVVHFFVPKMECGRRELSHSCITANYSAFDLCVEGHVPTSMSTHKMATYSLFRNGQNAKSLERHCSLGTHIQRQPSENCREKVLVSTKPLLYGAIFGCDRD